MVISVDLGKDGIASGHQIDAVADRLAGNLHGYVEPFVVVGKISH